MRAPAKVARQLAREVGAAEIRLSAGYHASTASIEALLSAFASRGRCCVCGRALTDQDSVARGIGPDCARKEGTSVLERYLDAWRARNGGI